MKYLIRNGKRKELIVLSAIYLLSQGFLLIMSGRWWDDWCFYELPFWSLKNFAMQMGRPSVIAIIEFVSLFPYSFYRIFTFLMFYASMIFLYRILKGWLDLSDESTFWICALYSIIPINDARVVLACFPYTVSVFFFMAGMCLVVARLNNGIFKLRHRLVSYLLFIVAFTMNSALVFYGLVLLMILMRLYKAGRLKSAVCFVDYLILPIAFFAIKSRFFPAYGLYANYNNVNLQSLIFAIKNIVPADINMMKAVFSNLVNIDERLKRVIICGVLLSFAVMYRKQICIFVKELFVTKSDADNEAGNTEGQETKTSLREIIITFVIGVIALSGGLFAYVVVRGSNSLALTGLEGRDSTLVAMGAAMIIYAVLSMFLKDQVKKYIAAILVLGGIVYFNVCYIGYQNDYYSQLGFQYQLESHSELENVRNIVYRGSDPMGTLRFYSLNGNARVVYGTDDKLIMNGFGDTSILHGDASQIVNAGDYNMSSYDVEYKHLDAVVDYTYSAGETECIKLKFLEILSHDKFVERLIGDTNMVVYMDGTEEYDQILIENGYENVE